jgi:hypothetical protein
LEADDTGEASDADEAEDEPEEFLMHRCLTLKHWLRCGRARLTLGEAQEEQEAAARRRGVRGPQQQ